MKKIYIKKNWSGGFNISRLRIMLIIVAITHICIFSSCGKFLEVGPPKDKATPEEVFSNNQIATSAITGIYSRMTGVAAGAFSGTRNSISVLAGLSADEFISHAPEFDAFYKNEIPSSDYNIAQFLWTETYSYIYTTNSILERLSAPNGVTEDVKRQLEGEAKFVRAFCYFYLVNLMGDVPLILTTDYRVNRISKRSSTGVIYSQIVLDLKDAESLLTPNYPTEGRVRPNKWAASALLARVYLYLKEWPMAELKATEVINQSSTYELLSDLNKVFLKDSREAIFQLMPSSGNNTNEGATFILTSAPPFVSLSKELIAQFDPLDKRRINWIGTFSDGSGEYFFPFKYKLQNTAVIEEYSMALRLAETYLIRAEARAELLKTTLALEDINFIRARAGFANPLTGLSSSQCAEEILKQRRLELFSEWGHRWLDLKRTNNASEFLSPLKGDTWSENDLLYPIPTIERNANPNVSQNPGYQ